MSTIRVLVGTRKGAFLLTSDGQRKDWAVSGPHFAGWEIYHLKGSPADPNRIYASGSSGWFGQVIQRSDDGGQTWAPVGNEFIYAGVPGTHQWYDGTQHPWEFKRGWHLEPSLTDPDHVYAGVEDAALFESRDGGVTWAELAGLREHQTGPQWQPGAGGMCLHTILLDPVNAGRMFVAISAAGAFRSDDFGKAWRPINRGLRSEFLPEQDAEVGHCVHRIAQHRTRPETLFMQKHWDVMRSDDGGENWREVSGNLPTDFGFPIDVHAHEPETIYVVPIKGDSEHFPIDGRLQVWRGRMARPAARCMARPTGAIRGERSCGICRRCCRWKCRRFENARGPQTAQMKDVELAIEGPVTLPAGSFARFPGCRVAGSGEEWKRGIYRARRDRGRLGGKTRKALLAEGFPVNSSGSLTPWARWHPTWWRYPRGPRP